MRKYRDIEPGRWKEILQVLRWQLEVRMMDVQRLEKREDLQTFSLPLLQKAYDDSRFLHRFLGYPQETKLEKRAAELLHSMER
ncbi:MAG: hypothetical protein Q4C45_06450 [Oscillospiraceae bacterium]|nr:hypothetical protein [Oscillospiraceae bacterium]